MKFQVIASGKLVAVCQTEAEAQEIRKMYLRFGHPTDCVWIRRVSA